MLGPILSGRDCVVLTADTDVFDQVFELHTLLNEQYGSLLIADDLRANPQRYTRHHAASPGFMQAGAVAYNRPADTKYLLPSLATTCASWVINVEDLSSLICIATRDVARTLSLQNSSETQRVADGGDGRTVHMSWTDEACRSCKSHFVVGHDAFAREGDSPVGRIRISWYEFAFVLGEKGRSAAQPRKVWMP